MVYTLIVKFLKLLQPPGFLSADGHVEAENEMQKEDVENEMNYNISDFGVVTNLQSNISQSCNYETDSGVLRVYRTSTQWSPVL